MPADNLISTAALFFEHERYRVIGEAIALKRPGLKLVFRLVGLVSRWRLGNALLIAAAIIAYRPMRRPTAVPLFQYGMSANNERVFRRINDAASRSQWNAFINGRSISFGRRLAVLRRGSALWEAAAILTRRRAAAPFSHAQLVLTAAASLVYRNLDFAGVRCICVASDHSPIVMALLDVARARGLRTCYVQHAPVADHFPPLDYDLSVLFDRSSAATYDRAASLRSTSSRGDIQILPPFEEDACTPSLDNPPYRIGICLSYLFDLANLSRLTKQLTGHPSVSSISLRRHPRCSADLTSLLSDERVTEPQPDTLGAFAAGCDIMLVPNSGVAIELLHLGKPTFYTPEMDHIAYDYYGFVRDGILPLYRPELLVDSDQAMAFFGAGWRERYAFFDETISETLRSSRARVGAAFKFLVEG